MVIITVCSWTGKPGSFRIKNSGYNSIDCGKAEEALKTTSNPECALNTLAIANPLEYARLYLDGTMQMWIDAEDSLDCW